MKNRIRFLKVIDSVIGPLLLRIAPRPPSKHTPPSEIKHILVIRPGGMGDAALLLPVLKEIKNIVSGIKIDLLCEPRNAGIFKASPHIDDIFYYDRPGTLLKILRKPYDIVFDTEQSHFLTAFVCSLLKADYKIGYATQNRGFVYHRALTYHHNRYEAENFWDLFSSVFPIPRLLQWNFPYFLSSQEKNWKLNYPIRTGVPFVCLFPGASKKECNWPETRWVKVADYLQREGYQAILLGGNLEIPICKKIITQSRIKKIIDLSGKLSLLKTAWLLEKASLLISTDSGILHVGVLCDIPTVSLFGSGIAAKWGPKGPKHTIVNKGLPCSPCALFGTIPSCSHNIACMMEITSEEVIKVVNELLNINRELRVKNEEY